MLSCFKSVSHLQHLVEFIFIIPNDILCLLIGKINLFTFIFNYYCIKTDIPFYFIYSIYYLFFLCVCLLFICIEKIEFSPIVSKDICSVFGIMVVALY